MDQEPKLENATFTFSQDGNCVDGGLEELTIRCESSLGIDNEEGCFYVLETKQWAIESVDELMVDYSAASAMAYPMSMLPARTVDEDAERRRIETELRDFLRGIEHQLAREGVTVSSEVRFGRPAEQIISFANDMKVEVIATSTHGRSGLARWACGSVADRVLHAARCPGCCWCARSE